MDECIEKLINDVFEANILLKTYQLVTFTWGNVSGIDRERGLVVIKPSGIDYDHMKPQDMVVLDLENGGRIHGEYRESSDAPTHLALYRSFNDIGGIVHTHSRWATVMAQSELPIEPLGTTHADYFYGTVPCTRALSINETTSNYEYNTGLVIAETFQGINPLDIPAVLVNSHGPFTWGHTPGKAVENAAVLEEISFMAWHNIIMNRAIKPIDKMLLDRHYYRKHGKNAYYGQINH